MSEGEKSTAGNAIAFAALLISLGGIGFSISSAKAGREHADTLLETTLKVEIYRAFSEMRAPVQQDFVTNLQHFKTELPEGVHEKLQQVLDDKIQRDNALDAAQIASEQGNGVPAATLEQINAVIEKLESSNPSIRRGAREDLSGLINSCNSTACATLFSEILPKTVSLAGSTYRITLGVLIAISNQSNSAFAQADAAARTALADRIAVLEKVELDKIGDAATSALARVQGPTGN